MVYDLAVQELDHPRALGALKGEDAGRADLFETAEDILNALLTDRSLEYGMRRHDFWECCRGARLSRSHDLADHPEFPGFGC